MPGLVVTGTDPVDVLADFDTTTVPGTNSASAAASFETRQQFNADVTAEINAGVTVNGFGLELDSTKTAGTVTVVNDGAIVADTVDADGSPALAIFAQGTINYSGSGDIRNGASTPHSGALNLHTSGGAAIVNILQGATITGDVGINVFGGTGSITISGTVEGTGGTAVIFDASSAGNIFELETTGHLIGGVIGSGTDTLVLCGGDNAAASFDLDQIVSGFTAIEKDEDSTWTVSGTLAANTTVNAGTLVLADATIGNTLVGGNFSLDGVTLGGAGTVGTLTIAESGVVAPTGIIHSGDLAVSSVNTFAFELGGATAGAYGQIDVTGTVYLGFGVTALDVNATFDPTIGDTFVIINNDDSDSVTGYFGELLNDGDVFASHGRLYSIDYTGGDGNDVELTYLGAPLGLIVTGSDPVDILADVDVTTHYGFNTTSPSVSIERDQRFDADITAEIEAGVTINGFGLSLETTKADATITVVNDGAIVIDDDPHASGRSALDIRGTGGLVSYSGSGTLSNAASAPFSDALNIFSSGDIDVDIDGGIITGVTGLRLRTEDGSIGVTMSGGQISALSAGGVGDGIAARARTSTSGFIDIAVDTGIVASRFGISALTIGTADISITADGTISADIGIDASVGTGKGGMGGGPGDGDIIIDSYAEISAVSAGIMARVREGSVGDISISANAAITVSAGDGIVAVVDSDAEGIVTVSVSGTIDATGGNGISVRTDDLDYSTVDVFGDVTSHDASFAGIDVTGGGDNLVTIWSGATVSGDTGVRSFAATTMIVVSGTVTGTGGTAIFFDSLLADDVLELETTGKVIGAVVGSGNDTLILCGGDNLAASFDLDQITGGFTTIEKEDDTIWTVTGTLAVETFVNDGALVLDNATIGDVTVGTPSTFFSATLVGTGTVGTLTVGDLGILAPGTLHSGSVTFDSGATFMAHGLLDVTGTVDLGGAALTVTPPASLGVGDSFVIISNDDTDPIIGTFAGLADGDSFSNGVGTFTIHYDGGSDSNDVTLTIDALFPGLIITGSGPVHVLASTNVTTVDADNFFTDSISNARRQTFNDDVDAIINAGKTINGWGLEITSIKEGGSVSVLNDGAVVLDDSFAGVFLDSALTIIGNGGIASYSGSGDVRNDIDFAGDGLTIANPGDISATISGGVINGYEGIVLNAIGGAITLDMTGGQIGTSLDPATDLGVWVTSLDADHQDVNLTTTAIWADSGIDVLLAGGTGDINITANGAISASSGSGITTSLLSVSKIGDSSAAGNTTIVTNAAIDAGFIAIDASVGSVDSKGPGGGEVGDVDITTNAAITSAGYGIVATVGQSASGDITITTNATIDVDFTAIDAFVGSDGKGGGGEVGDIDITTNAAITAGEGGVGGTIGGTATGDITITANAAISAAWEGIFALIDFAGKGCGCGGGGPAGGPGDIEITANATIDSTDSDAIHAENWRGSIDIAVNADVTSQGIGFAAIFIDGAGSALIEVASSATVKGETGIESFHEDGATVVVSGTVEGTGGDAVVFQGGTNILEMETTGTLTGSATGAGADTLVLCGGANAAAAFDLDQIVSGFTQLAKEEDSTWTVSGTLAVDTLVDEGTLVLANATVGNTTVGTAFTLVSATLAGSGTVDTLTVSDKGILAVGTSAGIIHSGDVTFQAGAVFAVELGGTAAGTQYDQLDVTGTVDLGDATLDLSRIGGFHPTYGTHFTIIANDGDDDVTGTFLGLAEGAQFAVGGLNYTISYAGGDGNDVVLTALGPPWPPTDIALTNASVAENSANGTLVGTLSDTDLDAGDTAIFNLTDDPFGRFAILGANLVVANGGLLNFEQSASHSVTVRVTDGAGFTFDKAFTISVTNVNEAPTNIALSNASVAENSANGTVVGGLSDTDPDASDAATFSLLNNAGGRFAISGSNLVVADGGLLNFERNTSHAVTVRVTDSGGLMFDKAVTVGVTDVAELPHWMASIVIAPHPAGWNPAGIGDFNGDATSDVAWYNSSSNSIDIWTLSNGQWAGSVTPGSHPAGYQPISFSDFNHDGTGDVLWYNPATQHLDLWKIANGQWAGSVDLGTHPAGWQPKGFGDFNGDGTSDIAWYNPASNAIDIWKIVNGQWAGSVAVGAHPAGYQPALTGDFNGDGTSDIAWYNPSTGDVDIWKLSNGQWAGSSGVGAHPAGWQPLGVGDFNEDHTSDIVWYNPATNNIDVWLIKNGQWTGSVDIGTHPAGAVAVGVGDFDHNGVSDIMWRDTATGHIDSWLLKYS